MDVSKTEKLTPRDVAYRMFRLRRLIVLGAVLPLPALALAIWAGVAIGLWAIPLWAAFVVFHCVRFPNSWLDIIAFGLTFSILLVISIPIGFAGLGPVFGYPLALLAGLFIWMKVLNSLYVLENFGWPQGRMKTRRRIALPAETVRDAFFLRPDATVGFNQCGPADANGVFPVTATGFRTVEPLGHFDYQEPTAEELDAMREDLGDEYVDDLIASLAEASDDRAPEPSGDITFFASVISHDETSQEVITMAGEPAEDGELRTQTMIQTVTPTRRGCVYDKLETGNMMGVISGAGFFLCDAEADYISATLDKIQGNPDRSLRGANRDSLLFMLARLFVRRGMADA